MNGRKVTEDVQSTSDTKNVRTSKAVLWLTPPVSKNNKSLTTEAEKTCYKTSGIYHIFDIHIEKLAWT